MDWSGAEDSDDESLHSPESESRTLSDSSAVRLVTGSSASSYPFRPQKELKYNNLLPYSNKISVEAIELLHEIKTNLAKGLLKSDPRFFLWVTQLGKFIRLYGRLFPKEDHLFFIDLFLKVIQLKQISGTRLSTCLTVLTTLLKKRELLSRDDLQISWRPLYELYERTIYKTQVNFTIVHGLEDNLKSLIRVARVYFPIKDTQDILDEFRPYLCPYDKNMNKGFFYLSMFLPTVTSNPSDHDVGYKLWFEELMAIWESNPNSPEWEQHLVLLFARLSHDTIGLIDWSSWVPKIFTHLMRSFDLQNGSIRVQVRRNYTVFDMNSVVLWIVSMLGGQEGEVTISHIEMMFKSLESYYYPSNVGKWNTKLSQLLSKLPNAFVKRLHRERFKKKTWELTVPDSHKISEEVITRFVQALLPVIDVAMFSARGTNDASLAMQHLSTIRPNLVLPPLLDKMYRSFETLTEPHRLISCIWCAIRVARSLVMGGPEFPEGPSHVIRLLMELLPGIDPNDIKKSTMTFQFVSAVASLITFVDCSAAIDVRSDLTPEEYNLCLASTQLESFVLQYFDRCFALIETSSFEHTVERTSSDQSHYSTQEMVVELGISSTLAGLILHSSPSIMDKAIDKLFAFLENRIFETKVAGKFVASVVFAIVRGCPEKVRDRFIPHFHRLIVELTSEEHQQNETDSHQQQTDEQLVFALQVMCDIVKGVSPGLVKHKEAIVQILERTLHHKLREVSTQASYLLRNTIHTLTAPMVKHRDERLDVEDFSKYLPIRDWGSTLELDDVKPVFFVPTVEDISFSELLIHQFLERELRYLDDWVSGNLMETPIREDINRSLSIIASVLRGGCIAFPYWDSEETIATDNGGKSMIGLPSWRVREIGNSPITLSDGSNIRVAITAKTRKVLKYIRENSEDDVKSLRTISGILHDVMFAFGVLNGDFNSRWKTFTMIRSSVENKLLGPRKHTRVVLLERIMLQQELRENQKTITPFTKLHEEIMVDLLTMSLSHYSEVRRKAQEVVNVYLHYFPLHVEFMTKLLLPPLAKGSDSHEAFKGSLYVILGENGKSLLNVSDWRLRKLIWLAVVDSKHSEKPSIIKLLQSGTDYFTKHFEPLNFNFSLSNEVFDIARKAWATGIKLKEPLVSEGDIEKGMKIQEDERKGNVEHYCETAVQLALRVEDASIHWHLKHFAYSLLAHMPRLDTTLPVEAVSVFTKNLINDSLMIRKYCFYNFPSIIKTQKRPHVKKLIEPVDRKSNLWLQYDPSVDYTKEDIWKSTDFVFKTYIGFYAYPKNGIKVIDYEKEPKVDRTRDELRPEEIPIFDFFTDESKVDQLLDYFALEEKKGQDKFSSQRYLLWKAVFNTFGPVFLPFMEKKITAFVASSQESQQRCAAEFIAGLFRGSRRWTYEQHVRLREFAAPLIKSMFQSIIPETLTDWGTCCATIFEREDGRRISWFIELVTDDPLNSKLSYEESNDQQPDPSKMLEQLMLSATNEEKAQQQLQQLQQMKLSSTPKETSTSTSFLHSSRIYCLLGVLQQQEWKILRVLTNLTDYLKEGPHLTQSFQIVRQRIGVLLANMFTFDVDVPCLPGTLESAPRRDDFVSFLVPQLTPLMTEEPNSLTAVNGVTGVAEQSPEKKAASNLIKTVCQWVMQNFSKNSCSTSTGLFQLLPFLCQTQTETTDEELMKEAKSAFIVFSHTMMTMEGIDCALKSVKQIIKSKSWRTRTAIATYLQYMVATNLFRLRSKQEYVEDVKTIVLTLMEDERIEVREAGATIFGGLIHCHFLPLTSSLKKLLISKSNHVVKKTRNPANALQVCVDTSDLVIRHSGVLGLCCIVNAYPYEVPPFLPQILMLLSSHLNDPAPIPATIKKTMNSFKRTHQDNWAVHKEKFTEDQLSELTDILVSPTYYA